MKPNRIAITGMGAVTPIGIGTATFWSGLKAGKNGVSEVTHFDSTHFRSHMAAEVRDFQPEAWIDRKTLKCTDRFSQFAIAAAAMAFEDAGLCSYAFDADQTGIIIGSGIGGSTTIEEGHNQLSKVGPRGIHPLFVSRLLINMAAAMVSIRYGLKGPISAPSVACSTGANAIGDAYRILQKNDALIMMAGSAEACITPLAFGGFCATRSMTTNTDPECASRPFDRDRDGFVMGEGAGVVVLEQLDHALNRGAPIYAEIVGYGNSADGYHLTAPEPGGSGMVKVMERALRDAGLRAQEVDYINAHGTSTLLNDTIESTAIQKAFGEHAKHLKVSSNKSMIGHLMAASGAVELIATVLSVHEGVVPPTIHYQNPDPDCPLDYVTRGMETIPLKIAMSNSFGFGGVNACLIVKKYGGEN